MPFEVIALNIEIKTDRFVLRPLSINDLDTVHIYASDPENTRFMMWLPNDTKEETARELTYSLMIDNS